MTEVESATAFADRISGTYPVEAIEARDAAIRAQAFREAAEIVAASGEALALQFLLRALHTAHEDIPGVVDEIFADRLGGKLAAALRAKAGEP